MTSFSFTKRVWAIFGLKSCVSPVSSVKLPKRRKLGIIRYADDLIVTANNRETLENIRETLKQWLYERGLQISDEKTRIVHIRDGFNFLGFNLGKYNGKLLIKPQKEKVLEFCQQIGRTIKSCGSWSQENLITKLNPKLTGFANYYQGAVSKETFNYINYRVWKYLWKWARPRQLTLILNASKNIERWFEGIFPSDSTKSNGKLYRDCLRSGQSL
ncbi:MAG: hypothetical protein F6K25_02300 [Okeania sp. SIO2G4]|nr:hypothetical protein [Okeania sp. SIO2G5]NEP91604.1 hypothetical protein [Okeania sp. SIO2F5]NEQ89635.1 hypothetical protein [Okeania sp. SIO2G4]